MVKIKKDGSFSVDLTKKFLWTSAVVSGSMVAKAKKANTTKAGIMR